MPAAMTREVNRGMTRPSLSPVARVVARMREGVSRAKTSHKRMAGFLLDQSREFKAIRGRYEAVALLREHNGWERIAEMMRGKIRGNMLRQHALLFTDRTRCEFEKIETDVMLNVLSLVEGSGNEYDRAAELADMKMTKLMRVALNEDTEDTEVTHA